MAKVVKLAQPGYDVKTAGDENLIYSSEWPMLNIHKQGSYSTNNNTTNSTVVTDHELGFIPAYWYSWNAHIDNWLGGGPYRVDDNRSEFGYFGDGGFVPTMTDKQMLFEINPGFHDYESKFYYYIFDLDITKPFRAPVTRVGAQPTGRASDKVFKLALPNKSIESNNLEDFAVHSNARSPLVHAVHQGVSVADGSIKGFGFTFYHNLGYVPMFFAYVKDGILYGTNNPAGGWRLLPTIDSFYIDENKISYSTTNAGEQLSLVVLKDPFSINQRVKVRV